MAGLLLELRRQIAKNHRKGIYGNASVQRRETPNMKDSVPKRNSMADMHQGKMLSEEVLQQKEQGADVKKTDGNGFAKDAGRVNQSYSGKDSRGCE